MRRDDRPAEQLSDEAVALAVQGSLFDLFRSMTLLPGAELEESGSLSRHHAFPGNPMFKGAWAPRLDAAGADEAIADTVSWFRAREAPFAFWWTGPGASPADLGGRLVTHGFEPWEQGAPGQVAALDELDWEALDRVPDGFTIERVVDEDGVDAFTRTFSEALEVPAWAGQAWNEATRALGIGETPWELYVGRLGGEPVATNILFCGAGVATVFGVGTVPVARGQGIGAAITLAAYADAQELGYRYGVLFATDLGAPVYRRIGFRDTEVRISRWLWRDEP